MTTSAALSAAVAYLVSEKEDQGNTAIIKWLSDFSRLMLVVELY